MEQIKQILKNKKIYLRDFIAIIVIFFLSLFVEQVLLQWNSFKNEKYEQTFQVSEVQKAENKDGETTYDILFDGRYVSSIYLIYQSKTENRLNDHRLVFRNVHSLLRLFCFAALNRREAERGSGDWSPGRVWGGNPIVPPFPQSRSDKRTRIRKRSKT